MRSMSQHQTPLFSFSHTKKKKKKKKSTTTTTTNKQTNKQKGFEELIKIMFKFEDIYLCQTVRIDIKTLP